MKRFLLGLVLLSLCLPGCDQAPAQSPYVQGTQTGLPPIDVYYSPKGGCTEAVVRELGKARSTVLVQAYSFTSVPIAKALVDAYHRGVKIEVLLDKSQRTEKYSSADFVINAGIPTKIDSKHAIAHNKIMVIDGQTVITGSFNFTTAAEEHNAENLLVIRSPELAAKYTANWQIHSAHSDTYEGKTQGYSETHRSAAATEPQNNGGEFATPAAGGYVASARSKVFHRADCKDAAKISAKNLVHYATREEAIQAGKTPSPDCNP